MSKIKASYNPDVFRLKLPYPPSLNSYYVLGRVKKKKKRGAFPWFDRAGNPGVILKRKSEYRCAIRISGEGKKYHLLVNQAVKKKGAPKYTGRIQIVIWVITPDKKLRDLDNLCKALLDALESAGVFENDSQIDDLNIRRHGYSKSNAGILVQVNNYPYAKVEEASEGFSV